MPPNFAVKTYYIKINFIVLHFPLKCMTHSQTFFPLLIFFTLIYKAPTEKKLKTL